MRVLEVGKLGDYDDTFGQKYWLKVHNTDIPVMLNSKSDISAGDVISGYEESEQKKTKKGKPYLLLKKVKIDKNEGLAGSPVQPPKDDMYELVAENNRMLKQLVSETSDDSVGASEQVDSSSEDKPIDMSDIPF